jgi:two-component system CheB/CheR fusion protein
MPLPSSRSQPALIEQIHTTGIIGGPTNLLKHILSGDRLKPGFGPFDHGLSMGLDPPSFGPSKGLTIIPGDLVPIRPPQLFALPEAATHSTSVSLLAGPKETQTPNPKCKYIINLQSYNLSLKNIQLKLQESYNKQISITNDINNILISANIATIILDKNLNIVYFNPYSTTLFNKSPIDIGSHISNTPFLIIDDCLLCDCEKALLGSSPAHKEFQTTDNEWFLRTINPTQDKNGALDGLVITYANVTKRKSISDALERATMTAQQANKAKSRLLAAASHDLRQPLQSLALLKGQLEHANSTFQTRSLTIKMGVILEAMGAMLGNLLDINHFDSGTIEAKKIHFSVDGLLSRLCDEFNYYALESQVSFKVVSCKTVIFSDPSLLEQILRNFLSNAFKYTQTGKILIGCRRTGRSLRFEVWDTGSGIASEDLTQIFEEYHRLDDVEHHRSLGLGLGLSIVKHLGDVLGHTIEVHSQKGRGSTFCVHIDKAPDDNHDSTLASAASAKPDETNEKANILIIESQEEVRGLLEASLNSFDHKTKLASDGIEALDLLKATGFIPQLILSDYHLLNGPDGLESIKTIRNWCAADIDAIILTGDNSPEAAQLIADHKCSLILKPAGPDEIEALIAKILAAHPLTSPKDQPLGSSFSQLSICVIDDDIYIRDMMKDVFESEGFFVHAYESAEAFLKSYKPATIGCLLIDAYLPGLNGLELIKELRKQGDLVPIIMITGHSDVAMAVNAMKAGAMDYLEKPINHHDLNNCVSLALELARDDQKRAQWHDEAKALISSLTERQFEIMERVLKGEPSKNIAADLNISQRTVENHRAAIMTRTGARSLPELARLKVAAQGFSDAESISINRGHLRTH